MAIDYSVNLPEVGTLILAGASIVVSHLAATKILGYRMKAVEQQLEMHSTKISALTDIIGNQRVMEERITNIRRDLDDLRRGKGYIREDFPRGQRPDRSS